MAGFFWGPDGAECLEYSFSWGVFPGNTSSGPERGYQEVFVAGPYVLRLLFASGSYVVYKKGMGIK